MQLWGNCLLAEIAAVCRSCKVEIASDHVGPCPHCNQEGVRDIAIRSSDQISLGLSEGGALESVERSRVWNAGLMALAVALTLASSFAGDAGEPGMLLGVVLGLISTAIGLFSCTNVEKRHTTTF